jgi:hypothetical protein
MEAICSFETYVDFQRTTQLYTPEGKIFLIWIISDSVEMRTKNWSIPSLQRNL